MKWDIGENVFWLLIVIICVGGCVAVEKISDDADVAKVKITGEKTTKPKGTNHVD